MRSRRSVERRAHLRAQRRHKRRLHQPSIPERIHAAALKFFSGTRTAGAAAILALYALVALPAIAEEAVSAGIARGLVLSALLQDAPTPAPSPEPSPSSSTSVQVYGGALVSFGSDAGTAATPTARIEVAADVADTRLSPTVRVLADLSALPGDSVDVASPETYKALEFSVSIAQPLSERLRFRLRAAAGFSSKLPGDPEARDKAARWADFGVEFGSDRGRLALGIGPDQRLDGAAYVPSVHVSGIVGLWSNDQGAQVAFAGDAILGLDLSSSYPDVPVARRDVIRAGLMVGWKGGQ